MRTCVADCPLGAKCEEVKMEYGKPVLYRCPWYVQIRGVDTNTGQETGTWGCAITWMPTLMINTANESRKSVAAIESFRNEMVKQGAQTQQMLLVAARPPNREQDGKTLEQAQICE
ncbi:MULTISPECIES: hypothetical protein [unclassified Nitrosospira]|uniref:hypothetical protein n=1 Tax=unclassified Nitrosospira TaxID=2609267 RepID=UPI000D441569|nr:MULTISPECIES: hypothetical protein [unclassified Nitrosospira]PTR16256.1 hypothetical protein C8R31_102270 [Nitrosospira sp. Nsp2]WON73743.1 hypothetical protein R5L00_14870 [Nitrosospira sp. Is2]